MQASKDECTNKYNNKNVDLWCVELASGMLVMQGVETTTHTLTYHFLAIL